MDGPIARHIGTGTAIPPEERREPIPTPTDPVESESLFRVRLNDIAVRAGHKYEQARIDSEIAARTMRFG